MARPEEPQPDRFTGLPPGVRTGALGRRFAAYLLDLLVPAVVALLTLVLPAGGADGGSTGLTVLGWVLIGLWALVVWWMTATRAASPGMRLMKLQLVGFSDGRPIGWGRVLLRALVLWVLTVAAVGLLVMLVLLFRHPRYQGWHDLAANAVVIEERALAPRPRVTKGGVSAISPAVASAPTTSAPPAAASPPAPAPVPAPAARQAPAPAARPAPALTPASPPAPAPVAEPVSASGPAVAVVADVAGPGAPPQPVEASRRPASRPDPTTRVRPPVPEQPNRRPSWSVLLDDGRKIEVSGLVVLGRKPEARPGEERAELIKVADETRTVSKSHLSLDVDGQGLFLVDRGSTNGSRVTPPDGQPKRCAPGEAVHLQSGTVVTMGGHSFTVQQG